MKTSTQIRLNLFFGLVARVSIWVVLYGCIFSVIRQGTFDDGPFPTPVNSDATGGTLLCILFFLISAIVSIIEILVRIFTLTDENIRRWPFLPRLLFWSRFLLFFSLCYMMAGEVKVLKAYDDTFLWPDIWIFVMGAMLGLALMLDTLGERLQGAICRANKAHPTIVDPSPAASKIADQIFYAFILLVLFLILTIVILNMLGPNYP